MTSAQGSSPKESYGCVNWQSVMPEKSDQLEQTNEQLKELFCSGSEESGESTIDDGMKLMYPLQCQLVNSGAKLSDVQENFPYLFTPRNLLKHFAELVVPYTGLVNAFRTKTKTSEERKLCRKVHTVQCKRQTTCCTDWAKPAAYTSLKLRKHLTLTLLVQMHWMWCQHTKRLMHCYQ